MNKTGYFFEIQVDASPFFGCDELRSFCNNIW